MAEDRLDRAVGTVLAATVTVVILCYMAIPTITDAIGSLTGGAAKYADLLGVVVVMMIIGLIVLIVRSYNSHSR